MESTNKKKKLFGIFKKIVNGKGEFCCQNCLYQLEKFNQKLIKDFDCAQLLNFIFYFLEKNADSENVNKTLFLFCKENNLLDKYFLLIDKIKEDEERTN